MKIRGAGVGMGMGLANVSLWLKEHIKLVTGGGALRPPRSPAPEPRSLAVKVCSSALKV